MSGPTLKNVLTYSDTSNFLRLPVPSLVDTAEDRSVGYNYNYFQKSELDSSKEGIDPNSQFIKLKWKLPPLQNWSVESNSWRAYSDFVNKKLAEDNSNLQKFSLLFSRQKNSPNKDNINFDVNPNYFRVSVNDEKFYRTFLSNSGSFTSLKDSELLGEDPPVNFQQIESLMARSEWNEDNSDFNSAPLVNFEIKRNITKNLFSLSEYRNIFNDFSGSFNVNLQNTLDSNNQVDFKFTEKKISINEDLDDDVTKYSDVKLSGFLIDKYVVENEKLNWIDSIILSNPAVDSYTDSKITYGKTYSYSIKSIYEVSFVTTSDDSDNQIALITGFIASSPSRFFTSNCINEDVPPYPADINFYWDERLKKPHLTWSEPISSKRDIKGFLVLKRSNIDSSFKLIKMYDFNDAIPRMPLPSGILADKVEAINQPRFDWVDDTFFDGEKSIYVLLSITAHGIYSRYSAQFEISWNDNLKKINKKLISRSGSPLSYPNLNIREEVFKDCIVEENFDSLYIYLDPSCYFLKGHKIDGFEFITNTESLNTRADWMDSMSETSSFESIENTVPVCRVVSTSKNYSEQQKYVFNFLNVGLQQNEKYELKIIEKQNLYY